jgi:hypothetical protein
MMTCRHCSSELCEKFIDLGHAPYSNAYLYEKDLSLEEKAYPLAVYVCTHCWLVQTSEHVDPSDLFTRDYPYFSSTSTMWLTHTKNYVNKIIKNLSLSKNSFVVEIASNDGYLLRNFVSKNIPCLGIEPTVETAQISENYGVPVIKEFFNQELSRQIRITHGQADLIIGNNVYAHVPEINTFTEAMKDLLAKEGCITLEFPHLLNLILGRQFDTVYHEHYSYLSVKAVENVFKKSNLRIWDIEKLTTHGGSLRIYGCHQSAKIPTSPRVWDILEEEHQHGLDDVQTYLNFQSKIDETSNKLVSFLSKLKGDGKKVAAYGAAAKGNTLLNYCGIGKNLIQYIADAAPAKQGRYAPGSHIPIKSPDFLRQNRPDYVLILPWNIAEEIVVSLSDLRQTGVKFFIAIPELVFL